MFDLYGRGSNFDCCPITDAAPPPHVRASLTAEERYMGDGIRLGRQGRNRKMSTFTYDTAARGAPPPKLTPQVRQKVVRELHTKIVESQGQLSSLVILSLPTLQQGKGVAGGDPVAFLDTMEELTAQLDHVLFVHGGEDQILTAEG